MSLKKMLSESGSPPLLGAFLNLPVPALVELIGRAGYDFIILDSEHGNFSGLELEECLRAADLVSLPTVVRLPEMDAGRIQNVMDSNAHGIQIPSVDTAELAALTMAATRFPPRGNRGFGSTTRAAGYGFVPRSQVLSQAEARTTVTLQVETRRGVENLLQILAVDGIDSIFIGTSDLSLEYGYQSTTSPEMMSLLKKIIGQIDEAGKVCGVHIVDWKDITPMMQLGVRYFTVSALAVMGNFLGELRESFREKAGALPNENCS